MSFQEAVSYAADAHRSNTLIKSDSDPTALPKRSQSAEEMVLRKQLQAVAKGDKSSFADFYDATIGRVYGLALRITGRSHEAEEVVSDVYLQVWRQASSYDDRRGLVVAWLLTICRSRALDHLRRRDPAESHPNPNDLRHDLAHDENPESLMLALRRDSSVYTALAKLSPVQRQLVGLAFFRGLSHKEIADHVSMPLGSVKTHIRKALRMLYDELGPDVEQEFVTR